MNTQIVKSNVKKIIKKIYSIVSQDEGKRNIGRLVLASTDELELAARALYKTSTSRKAGRILILTGFPCHIDADVPQESDGPLGALCIARALSVLGQKVEVLTDKCCVSVFDACHGASVKEAISESSRKTMKNVEIRSFDENTNWFRKDLLDIELKDVNAIVAIERAGANAKGEYMTASKKKMNHLVTKIDNLFATAHERDILTVAIGDGGNELGMGGLMKFIQQDIKNGKDIGCVTGSEHVIPCSVSNWGGYALAGALSAIHLIEAKNTLKHAISFLPTLDEEDAILDGGLSVGMKDGLTGKCERSVDGLSWDESRRVLRDIRILVGDRY
jgi:D-glutamate cyclase